MACIYLVSGKKVVPEPDLARWAKAHAEKSPAEWRDLLRRKVAERQRLPSFRQVALVNQAPSPSSSLAERLLAVIKPYCEASEQQRLDFLSAARRGDAEKVAAFLDEPIHPGLAAEYDRSSPLHVAARHGHEEIVRCLLDARADIHLPDVYGRTALHSAALGGHPKLVNSLLEAGADKDGGGEVFECSPLYLAAMEGHAEVVTALLQAGADKEKRNSEGLTPLHVAAGKNQVQVVRRLLDAGADKEIRGKCGRTPLAIATKCGCNNVARLLQSTA